MSSYAPRRVSGLALQHQVESLFLKNIRKKPYHSISVSELCKQAGIARKSFYNHYPTKEACFGAIIERMIEDSILHTDEHLPSHASMAQFYHVYLEYWKEQKWFLDIIQENQLQNIFVQQNIQHILKEDKTVLQLLCTSDAKPDMDVLQVYASSEATLLMQWHSRGYDTPVEEMAQKYIRLIHTPILPPLEDGQIQW